MLAVLVKSALFLHFFGFEGDKLLQAVAAHNLASGQGLTYFEVHADALQSEVKVPLNRWPPGYSLVIAALYKITGNLVACILIFDLVVIISFLLVLKRLLQQLEFPVSLINLLVLFNGFTIAVYISHTVDLLAVVLILLSINLTLQFYQRESNPVRSGIMLGLFSFLPAFFRYMYIPSSIVTGSVLLFAGIVKKDKRLITGAVYSLAITLVAVAALLVFNNWYAGSAAYVMPMEKGLYPDNLLKLFPFFFNSFINLNFILTQLELRTRFNYSTWYSVFVYANFVTCFFIFLKFVITIRSINFQKKSIWKSFVFITAGVIISTTLLMGYLSTTNGPRITLKGIEMWTFVEEGRYFSFAMITIPVIASYYLFTAPFTKSIQLLRYLFIALVFFEVIHTGYFIVTKFRYRQPIENATLPLTVKKYLKTRISQLKSANFNVVISGHTEIIANWGVLNGAKGLLNSDEIIAGFPDPDPATVLLFVIEKKDKKVYIPYLSDPRSKLDTIIDDYYIYSFSTSGNGR